MSVITLQKLETAHTINYFLKKGGNLFYEGCTGSIVKIISRVKL